MIQNLVIISAGQFGRETLSWAVQAIEQGAPWRVKGFLDDRPGILDGFDYESRVIGDVRSYRIDENDVFVGAIGDPAEKRKYYSPIVERGGRFVNLIHPKANVGINVRFGVGVVMAPFSSVTCDVRIGNFVSIGGFSNVGHDAVVGDWCQISGHCGINGGVTLGEGAFLGGHVCVTPRTAVGEWAFVGAGSVVIRDVQPGVKVLGNPAITIGRARG